MKSERYLTEEASIKKGVDALVKELGPVEAMRFLRVPRERRQEGVKRHREWQKMLNKDRFFEEVFGFGTYRGRSNDMSWAALYQRYKGDGLPCPGTS